MTVIRTLQPKAAVFWMTAYARLCFIAVRMNYSYLGRNRHNWPFESFQNLLSCLHVYFKKLSNK